MSAAPAVARDLDWQTDGARWPNRDASRFIDAAGFRWHVQRAGSGPVLLLLHGTGASTHSWRDLLPLLARDFDVVAPDLPGHGFTTGGASRAATLPGMAAAVAALLDALGCRPVVLVGHSAGAAVGVRLCLDGAVAPRLLVGLNAALVPFGGVASLLFPPAARLFAVLPGVPGLFARRATQPGAVRRLLESTGSRIDAEGEALYARLVQSPAHVAGVLAMMAAWDLRALGRELPRLAVPLLLVVGTRDATVEPQDGRRIARLVPGAEVEYLEGLGHLAHEEQPLRVAGLIARRAGVAAGA